MSAQEKEPYEEMSKIDELRYLEEVRQGDGLTMELFWGVFFFLNTHEITVLPCHQMDGYKSSKPDNEPHQYHVVAFS